MAIVVVGGQTKDIGKTSVVAGIIAAMPEMRWTAIKITQSKHPVCPANSEGCECVMAAHSVAVREERVASSETDSSRYLAAGAVRAFWVRVQAGQMEEAMPWISEKLAEAQNVVLESNSILGFLWPDVYLSLVDPGRLDFKESSRMYLDRADALLVPQEAIDTLRLKAISSRLAAGTRVWTIDPSQYCSPELVAFLRERLGGAALSQVAG